LDGRSVRDPEAPATESSQIAVDGNPVLQTEHVYFAMNKPRGIVTTASDEKGRKTVMDLLQGKLPQHVFPVGRLDKASEGLLLFTNDTAFADKILAPETHLEKEYHVQVSRLPSAEEMEKMQAGVLVPPRVFGENAEWMQMAQVRILRTGEKNAWLSVVLHEGKNREIRKLMKSIGLEVARLIRLSYGPFQLGSLKKGEVKEVPQKVLKEQLGGKL
jgi:23S rRNA pseudouridine2605 synthase